jgi:hypothetical protein
VTVRGTSLRALLAGASVALLVSVVAPSASGRLGWTSLVAGAALVAWVVASPGSMAPTGLLLLVLVVALDAGPPPAAVLAVQGACLSGVHLLAALAALAPPGAHWEVAAVRPTLRRWLVAQVLAAPVVALAVLAPGHDLGAGLDVAGGVVLVALAAYLLVLALRGGGRADRG